MSSERDNKRNVICRYCLKKLNKYSSPEDFKVDETEEFVLVVKETFDIQICNMNTVDKIICLQCISNINFSAKVKKQICDVQKILTQIYTNLGCESPKQELDSSGFEEYAYDDSITNDLGSECKKVIANTPSITKAHEESKSVKEIDIKLEPVEETEVLRQNSKMILDAETFNSSKNIKFAKDRRKVKNKMKLNNIDTEKSTRPSEKTKNTMFDNLKTIRNNTLKLLTNSNMCPFISKRTKFACYSCAESFLDIRQLREHSLSHSSNYAIKTYINRCRGMTLKNVDISNLTCKLCSEKHVDIDNLRDHLIDKHSISFDSPKHLLLPFKLEDGFQCVICLEKYFSFNRLYIHMNSHSTSNVCETCGVVYMNRISLRNHINSMHTQKKCSKCPEIFNTSSAKAKHMRLAHNMGPSKRYCMKCDMIFTYAHQLKLHMVQKHGEKRVVVECEHCGKKFSAIANLRVHIRSVHIGERNYPCGMCHLRFFTSCDKARHEKTHGDGKSFSCDFCEVKFRSKDSQRRHLRRQHGKSKEGS